MNEKTRTRTVRTIRVKLGRLGQHIAIVGIAAAKQVGFRLESAGRVSYSCQKRTNRN